jgi:hypothetical protein
MQINRIVSVNLRLEVSNFSKCGYVEQDIVQLTDQHE